MKSKLAAAAFITLLGVAACGGERAPATSALQTQDGVLTVKNDHWLDVTIYAVRAGTRHRIGTAAGLKTETLPINNSVLVGAGTVRFRIEPIGAAGSYLTEPFTVGPNDHIELNVRSPLNLTTFSVSRR